MANKHYSDIQKLADNELTEKLAETQVELTRTRFDQAISGAASAKEIREARKNIARIQTELRTRELAKMTETQLEKRSRIRFRRSK